MSVQESKAFGYSIGNFHSYIPWKWMACKFQINQEKHNYTLIIVSYAMVDTQFTWKKYMQLESGILVYCQLKGVSLVFGNTGNTYVE